VPATNAASSKGIFVVATYSNNQTNKADGMCHLSVYLLDVYVYNLQLFKTLINSVQYKAGVCLCQSLLP
jgi:hypothetical protein